MSTPPRSPVTCASPANLHSTSNGSKTKAPTDPAKKLPRKKKVDELDENGNPKPPKEKKPRKPREPKDPNKPPRKKQKVLDSAAMAGVPKSLSTLASSPYPSQAVSSGVSITAKVEPEAKLKLLDGLPAPAPPPRPATSGTRYDPIRSQYTDSGVSQYKSPNATPSAKAAIPARAPSSIFNLIEPTSQTPRTNTPSRAPTGTSTTAATQAVNNGFTTAKSLPTERRKSTERPATLTKATNEDNTASTNQPSSSKTETLVTASSPKPVRQKEVAPPLPLGSGLLSISTFGKSDLAPHKLVEVPNQCIVIDVPKNQGDGNYVNFMKEVEAKYGFDVAYPRIAEHRRRMRAVAAAGAAIESGAGSPDEMALDASDGESNAEMGGVDDESALSEGNKKKGKRTRANQYDKNDDFIDDAELLWEEQALASKDGYFVWSGPLLNESDKAAVEKADGTTKRGGRGRGRGGAGRGGSGETSTRGGARGGGAGGGKGTRGGGGGGAGGAGASTTVRKPRITKAERAKMEAEKVEGERAAAAVTVQVTVPVTPLTA